MNNFTEIIVDHNKITTLTLKGANGLNILNYKTIESLNEIVKSLDKDSNVEALIITGYGNKAFCSGADINELSSMGENLIEDYVNKGFETFLNIENFHCPVIGSINGYAFGAAFELLLSCDIRIMSNSTTIGQPAVTHGLVPPFGGLRRLPSIVGIGNAKYIIYSAKQLSSEECLNMGLVNQCFEYKDLATESFKLAEKIIQGKKYSLSTVKSILNNFDSDKTTELEKLALIDCLKNTETQEQLKSFFEKNRVKNRDKVN